MTPLRIMLILALYTPMCIGQSCPEASITLSTQAEVDNFIIDYPTCTFIDGDVCIGDCIYPYAISDITNLDGLENIETIDGSILINNNPSLINLSGLSNLDIVIGHLRIVNDDALLDMSGLENLISIGGDFELKGNANITNMTGLTSLQTITGDFSMTLNNSLENFVGLTNLVNVEGLYSVAFNNSLVNFEGMSSLQSIGDFVHIWNNNQLVNMTGFASLNSIGGSFTVQGNDNLVNLLGMESLSSIDGSLSIKDNENLVSIDGIENIDPETILSPITTQADVELYDNISLMSCALSNICSVYNEVEKDMNIFNNGADCDEVLDLEFICNPQCNIVYNVNSTGLGSLKGALDCTLDNDTIFIVNTLALDTIWMDFATIDYDKSITIIGPANGVTITTSLEAPLVSISTDQVLHLVDVNLKLTNQNQQTLISNDGTLILENSKIMASQHTIVNNLGSTMMIRGQVELVNQ